MSSPSLPHALCLPGAISRSATLLARVPVLLALGLLLSGCASGGILDRIFGNNGNGWEDDVPAFSTEGGIAYETRLTGIASGDLKTLLEESSELISLEERLPASLGALRRRAQGDEERLKTALRSEGYYDAEVSFSFDRERTPLRVTVDVVPGTRYKLAGFAVTYEGSAPPAEPPSLEALGITLGMPARAPDVIAAENTLLRLLARRGHPLARIPGRRAVVNHDTQELRVTLRVDAGALARFGKTELRGNEGVKEDYARALIDWQEGEIYDEDKVEETRRAYARTGLFGGIGISHADAVVEDGFLPMDVELSEAAARSVGFGGKYSTSDGIGANASWEHRNLFGRNEQLRFGLTVAEIEQVLSGRFVKPRFLRPDQELMIEGELANRNTDAFDERGLSGGIALKRPWLDNWEISAGLAAEYSVIKDDRGRSTFQLFGVPLSAARDSTDNALDPSRGSRLSFVVIPYTGLEDGDPLTFVKSTVTGSAYYAIDSRKRYILAGLVRAGSIAGAETPSVPANKRYYAGGGGSIRGYEYQKVGPLDSRGEPLGGRSLFEVKGELRVKATESIGIVPFVDGGNVFDNEFPDFREDLRWAGGLGFRYFTDFGPIRADIALPLNKRPGDDNFQFYISIGQAF